MSDAEPWVIVLSGVGSVGKGSTARFRSYRSTFLSVDRVTGSTQTASMTELRTPRLLLRSWRDQDLPAYAALNADPEVRRWFPGVLTRSESDDQAARLRLHEAEHGFTFWAAEVPGVAPFIGFVGLLVVRFPAPFTPAIEIGWRLARAHWGHGYATEAARVVLAHALGPLGVPEIVAFTVPANVASRRVMEKIGMGHDPAGDFDHPDLPDGHPMRRHVLYRTSRPG